MKPISVHSTILAVAGLLALAAPASAMYQPTLGRWLQRDPAGYHAGGSLYHYAGSRPIQYVDPTGLFIEVPQAATLVGGGAAASAGGTVAIGVVGIAGAGMAGYWFSDTFIAPTMDQLADTMIGLAPAHGSMTTAELARNQAARAARLAREAEEARKAAEKNAAETARKLKLAEQEQLKHLKKLTRTFDPCCSYVRVPASGGNARHDEYVSSLNIDGSDQGWEVTTPFPPFLSCRFDGARLPNEFFEAKTGHEWLDLPWSTILSSWYLSMRLANVEQQAQRCHLVATICGHSFKVYVDNPDGANGYRDKMFFVNVEYVQPPYHIGGHPE